MATLHFGWRRAGTAIEAVRAGLTNLIRGSRPVRAALATCLFALLLLAAGAATLRSELRAREVKDSRRSLTNLGELLAESTSRTLENVDLVLQSVLDEMRENDVNSPGALAGLKSSRSFFEMLKARATSLPQLNTLSVVDMSGRLVSHSRGFPGPDIDISDRQNFQRLRDGRERGAFVGDPVHDHATGAWTVYLAKRIEIGSGETIGIVYAGLSLDYFRTSFARLALGRGASVGLWRFDGTLLVRYPDTGHVGQRFDTRAFRELGPDSPPLVYETESSMVERPSLVARHVVKGFPIATIFAHPRTDILRQSRQEEILLLAAAGLLGMAIIALTAALIRQFWAYEAVAQAERERATAVADLGELENQLRQSQKLEVIGQLASGVAHDFNNLLTVVIGNLDRLNRRFGDGNPDLGRYAASARSGAERAAALSQRLLAFSRRQPLDPMRLDPNQVIGNLTELLRQSLGKRAVLEMALAPGLPPVFADQNGLESALLNLVVNARDAMPEGGTVTISSRLQVPAPQEGAAWICIVVADTGTGMAPEVAARAFEPFFTTKEAGIGTGLGLAQVSGFARQYGGTVGIDTALGEGCRVTIGLPAMGGAGAAADPDPSLAAMAPNPQTGAAPPPGAPSADRKGST